MNKKYKINFHGQSRDERKKSFELLYSNYLEVIKKKLGSTKWEDVKIDLFKINNDVVCEITAYKGDYFGDDFEGLTKSFKMYDVFEEQGDN